MKVAFDLSILIYANYHVVKGFATKIDPLKFTEKIMDQAQKIVLDLQKSYRIEEFVFCADSPNTFRKEIYPEYKANREKNEELDSVKSTIINCLSEQTDVLVYDRLEGDDLLFLYAKKNPGTIIVSQDNDCKLMLNKDTILYRQNKQEFVHYDKDTLDLLKITKVILGDSGDNVPKLLPKGKGEKYLEQYFQKVKMKKPSIFYKEFSNDHGIPMEDIVRNVHLTNYSTKIYQNYFDIQTIIDEIC